MDRIQETLNEIARVDSAISARLALALASLLQARDYSQVAGASPWDFAVEISALRTFGLTNNDLRWLSLQGVIAHAEEIPKVEAECSRTFQPHSIWYVSDRTCAILTDLGLEVARALRPADPGPLLAFRADEPHALGRVHVAADTARARNRVLAPLEFVAPRVALLRSTGQAISRPFAEPGADPEHVSGGAMARSYR